MSSRPLKDMNDAPASDNGLSEHDDKKRIEAIYVAVFTVFVDSIMFSIVLPSMAIYLATFVSVEDNDYAMFLGILVAAHPFGQLVMFF